MADRVLRGWAEIETVSPWKDKPGALRKKYGKWLIDNGYIVKDFVHGHHLCFTWESVLKAGILRAVQEKNAYKRQLKESDFGWVPLAARKKPS